MSWLRKLIGFLFVVVLLPSYAFAQATLAGVAKDASGRGASKSSSGIVVASDQVPPVTVYAYTTSSLPPAA